MRNLEGYWICWVFPVGQQKVTCFRHRGGWCHHQICNVSWHQVPEPSALLSHLQSGPLWGIPQEYSGSQKDSWFHGSVNRTTNSNLEKTVSDYVNENLTVFVWNAIPEQSHLSPYVEHRGFSITKQRCSSRFFKGSRSKMEWFPGFLSSFLYL